MNLSLEAQYRTISVEAKAGPASLQQALTRLPGFMKETTKRLVEALSHPIDALFPARNLHWAVEQLVAVPYPQMRSVIVPCIPGIRVDYLTYTDRLADDAKFCSQFEAMYLDPLIDYLARKLNNPDGLRSVQPDDALDHMSLKEFNAHNAAMGKVLDLHNDKAQKPYGQLIRRNADWPEILAHSQTIHAVFTQADHDRFKTKFDRAKNLLDTLIQRLTHGGPDAYKISAPVFTKVVDATYVVAHAVELYGLTYRRALVLDFALDQLIDSVKKKAA